jgi:hypothetical protein
VRLLSDLRVVFGDADALATEAILSALQAIDEAPWSDIKGKPLDPRKLANYLRPYGVASKRVRIGASILRGYAREDLHDPWMRYLGEAAKASATTATTAFVFSRACPDCDGRGRGTCGEFKPATGDGL